MRRWFLLLLLSAAPASAQEASPPPGSPAEAAPAPAPAPPPRPQVKAAPPPPSAEDSDSGVPPPPPQLQLGSVQETIRHDAQSLVTLLLAGDARGAAPRLLYPFQLEERRFDAPEPLVAAWVKALRARRTDLVVLYDIEVLTLAEMEKKYGKPPARLGAVVPRGVGEVYAAVANLSGHAAVFLYRQSDGDWRPFAYTD